MSDTAIRVENLGKKYQLRHQQEGKRYKALRDVITGKAKSLFRTGRNSQPDITREEFWALKEVSFEIKQGEAVGIIGRNGAGKSTLLKLLSRITEPTTGRVELEGSVASLLEVGTGFHPELTGRENIFLNGAIMGMSRAEIKRKFDEIVAFAEVEKFLDTPVKRYSSGMYMRLAFGVAAHLEPDILVVDEVLAVGDAEFQKKCLSKMEDVSKGGRTVLFVSHNMASIQRFCSRAILLKGGRAIESGPVSDVVRSYIDGSVKDQADSGLSRDLGGLPRGGEGGLQFTGIKITNPAGNVLSTLAVGMTFQIQVTFKALRALRSAVIGFGIHTVEGTTLFASHTNDFGNILNLKAGTYEATVTFTPNYLRDGSYVLSLGCISGGILEAYIQQALILNIEKILHKNDEYYDDRIGCLFIPMHWSEPRMIDGLQR